MIGLTIARQRGMRTKYVPYGIQRFTQGGVILRSIVVGAAASHYIEETQIVQWEDRRFTITPIFELLHKLIMLVVFFQEGDLGFVQG